MVKSAYIHIPFCKQKCKYCSFVSFANINRIKDYIEALCKEIRYYYKGETLDTLYFGGGTPSLVETSLLKEILLKFNLSKNCEITLELNPDDATFDYLERLHEIGINRLSIGSQTFNDNTLKLIGRRHSAAQTIQAVKQAKQVGFKNISLDLIYGLPTEFDISKNLEILTSLEIQHISTYGLKIEENSFFGKHIPSNLPNDDVQADLYILINKFFEEKGYKRYEISNFSLTGFESRHNLTYWNNNEYYGFGISAHGYVKNVRYSNTCSFDEYIKAPTKHSQEQILTAKERLEEEIFLGFRKESGINTNLIKEKFKIDFDTKYKHILEKFTPEYIEKTPQGYKLTLKGVLLSNYILSEFI